MTPPAVSIVRLVADAYRTSQCEMQSGRKTKYELRRSILARTEAVVG